MTAGADSRRRSVERFDVWQYLPDGWRERIGKNLDAETAVTLAHSYTTRPAVMLGVIRQVQIVSRDDEATVFLWRRGEGVVFPTTSPNVVEKPRLPG